MHTTITTFIIISFLLACGSPHAQGQHLLSPGEFQAYSDSASTEQILDVRTPEEWQDGIIENASLINWFDKEFAQKAKEQLTTDNSVMVYCGSGYRSAKAVAKLKEMGFQVLELEGGMDAWKEENRKTVKP